MRILLVGGNGFIGGPLTAELCRSGHQVAVFHRNVNTAPGAEEVLQIEGDRNRLSDYGEQIREFAPDVIVDLILSSGEQARALMKLARGLGARVVALSSMDVYRAWGVLHGFEPGGLEPLPITEDSPVRTVRKVYPPDTVKMLQKTFTWLDDQYDKIAVEEAIMNAGGVAGTVLRLPMVYGPGDRLHRFFPLLKRFEDGRSSLILADDLAEWRAPRGYVENVAHGIALAAMSSQAAGRIYNICQEPSVAELEWQEKIAEQMQWRVKFVVLTRERTPKHLLLPGNAAQHVVVSSGRIRRELGYAEPVEIDEGIRRTVAWERANPPYMIEPKQFDYAAEDAALAAAAA